jgi:hypothetical protein
MHHCAFCKNPLPPLAEWKGDDGRFYCSEFCADAGDTPERPLYRNGDRFCHEQELSDER